MAVFQNFFNSVNSKYNVSTKLDNAKNFLLKNGVDVGTAIVNVLGATGIAGFKFHIPETELVKMEAQVTDHYVDTNSAVQDHIALRPVEITLTGLVGDYFYSVNQIEDFLANVTPAISLVKEYMPKLAPATMYIKSKFNKSTTAPKVDKNRIINGEASLNTHTYNAMDLFSLFQELYKLKSAQTRAFFFFEAMWKARATFTVETTWKRYDNMTITSLQPTRDENADITNFTITFKQLSFAENLTETIENYAERMKAQKAKTVNKGIDKGEQVETIKTGKTESEDV